MVSDEQLHQKARKRLTEPFWRLSEGANPHARERVRTLPRRVLFAAVATAAKITRCAPRRARLSLPRIESASMVHGCPRPAGVICSERGRTSTARNLFGASAPEYPPSGCPPPRATALGAVRTAAISLAYQSAPRGSPTRCYSIGQEFCSSLLASCTVRFPIWSIVVV